MPSGTRFIGHPSQLSKVVLYAYRALCSVKCDNIVLTTGQSLQWVDQLRYLGVFIVRSVKFKCSLDHAKKISIVHLTRYLARLVEPLLKKWFFT